MRRFLIAGAAAWLAACGTLPAPPEPSDAYWLKASAARPASRVDSLLAYAEYIRGLSAAEAAREHERMRTAFSAKDRGDFVRLQYALLLAVSSAPLRDLPRARQALEPLLKEEGHDAELRRLAAHLQAGIGDLLEAERHARDEQRRGAEAQRRAADLEQKLEALKSIERRIIKRTAPEPRR